MKAKITKRVLDTLEPGDDQAVIWDTEVAGFGARFQGGAWRYVVKYRIGARQRWYSIGRHGAPWTPDTARGEARRLLGLVAGGVDPAADNTALDATPTLAEFAVRYIDDHAIPHKKAASVEQDRANLRRAILPALGALRLDNVTRADVVKFHLARKDTPTNANRCLALLSHMFTMAEKWGLRPDNSNPCRHVGRFRETKRRRFLSAAELARLGQVLAHAETGDGVSPYVTAAVRLLIFTGARVSEILNLRWQDVDTTSGVLALRDSKTGPKQIYLNAPAVKLLAGLPRLAGNPHVIAGTRPGGRLVDLEHPWQRLRAKADLDDVRLHDLRHSFASVAAASGQSLPIIGALLGHTQAATTQRYAHLSADPLRAASEAVAAHIAAALEPGGEVAELAEFEQRRA